MARILYFTRDYTPHDHRFLEALAATDHQVYYLRLERSSHQVEDRPLPANIEQIKWAGGQSTVRWQDGRRLLQSLRKVLHSVHPDLVQAGPIQRCALLTAMSGFRPLVSMSWGYDLIVDANRSRLWRWATKYTLQRSAVLIGDSEVIRRLATSFGMRQEKIITFPWGIKLDHFSPKGERLSLAETASQGEPARYAAEPRPARSPDEPFLLLSTRAWEPIYGVDVIARAFVIAARQIPSLRLMMLGNGSQAAFLHQIFGEAGLLDQVHFPGQVSQADLPRYYRSADLYISASHSDGTSISLLEAMACGCPVLVSNIPGNQEWVQDGVQGWLFQDGSAEELAKKIVEAVRLRQHLSQMGQAAHLLAEQRADWKKNFQCLFQAYEFALADQKKR